MIVLLVTVPRVPGILVDTLGGSLGVELGSYLEVLYVAKEVSRGVADP